MKNTPPYDSNNTTTVINEGETNWVVLIIALVAILVIAYGAYAWYMNNQANPDNTTTINNNYPATTDDSANAPDNTMYNAPADSAPSDSAAPDSGASMNSNPPATDTTTTTTTTTTPSE